jgi:hypothetical protein
LAGRGKVGVKEALVGTISGGVIMGDAAPLLPNIGIPIIIGGIGGLLSGLYMRLLHPRINRNNVIDVLGLFGPFLISAFLGAFVFTPSIIIWFTKQHRLGLSVIGDYPATLAGWQLTYVGISAAIGFGSGLLGGVLCLFDRDNFGLAADSRIFENDFGLSLSKEMTQNYLDRPSSNSNKSD